MKYQENTFSMILKGSLVEVTPSNIQEVQMQISQNQQKILKQQQQQQRQLELQQLQCSSPSQISPLRQYQNTIFVIGGASSVYATIASKSIIEEPSYDETNIILTGTQRTLFGGDSFGQLFSQIIIDDPKSTKDIPCKNVLITDQCCDLLEITKEGLDLMNSKYQIKEKRHQIDFLRQYPFLRDIPTIQLLALLSSCVLKELVRGDVVYRERQSSDRMFFIKSGEVEISKLIVVNNEDNTGSINDNNNIGSNGGTVVGQGTFINLQQSESIAHLRQITNFKRVSLKILNDSSYFGQQELLKKQNVREHKAVVTSIAAQIYSLDAQSFWNAMAANDLVSVFEKENGVKQIWEEDHRQTFQKVQNEYASPVHRQKQQPNNTNNNIRNSANQQISGSASIPSFSGFQSQRSICVSPSRQHTDRQGSFEENEEPNNNYKNDQQQQESPSLVHQQSTSPNRRNSPQITQIREQSTLQAIPSFSSISPSSTQLPLETKDSSPYKHRPTPLLIKMQSADQQRNITQNYSNNKNPTGNQGVIKIQNTQNKGITEDQSPRKIISQQQQYQQKIANDINNPSSSQLDASPLKQASSKETSPMRSHRYFNYNNSKQRSNNNINTSQPRFQQQYQQSQNNISSSCTSQQVKTLITNTLTTSTAAHSNLPIIQSSFQSQSNIDHLPKNASQPNLLSCVWGDDNDNDQILSKQKDVMLRKYINRESNSQADRMANTARLKLESLPYKPQSQQDNGIQKPTIRRDEGGEDASQLYYDLSPIKRDILTDLVRKTNKKFLGQQQIDKIEGNKPGIVISNGTTRERWNSQDSQNVNPCLQSSQQFILPIHPDIIKSMSNKRKHNMLRTAISEMGQDSAREKRIYNESTLPRTLEKMKESALRKKSSMILSGPMLVALTNNDSQEINHIIEENISRNKRISMGGNENAEMLDVHVDKINKEDLEKYEKEGQIMQISSSSRQSSVNQPSRNENSNTQPYSGMLTERIPSKGPWVSNSPLKRNKTQYTHLKAYIPGDNSTANPATATKASILQMSLTTVSLTRKLQPTANKQQHQGTLEINEAQEKQQLTSQGFQNDASLRNKETFPQTQQLGDTGRIRGSNHIIGGGIQGRSIEGQGYGVSQKSSTQLMQHPIINSALFSNSARDTAQQFASTSQFQYSPMRNVKKF